ncbi:MAG: phosphoribosylaminoimidazolesuccinocarboxamide synthase [Bacteroidales bacterium]|nr:phosphoribosylaminoimidazolesuccinocarboxamide synthase [Bacteroidales bacterium]
MKALTKTCFNFKNQRNHYIGKVRDVYDIGDEIMLMIVTDRISAFDVVLPKGIPFKGQVLNQIAAKFLDATADIVPNWKIDCPDPMVTVGHKCEPYPIEMIVRAYLTGSSWREYKNGARQICGIKIPEGMKEHQAFDNPILTPTTKAQQGFHDENITREQIIAQKLITEEEYTQLEDYSLKLFKRGSKIANEKGLILVDTKYEFGKKNGQIYLIDEIHTPDSSRYFYLDTYQDRFDAGENQHQLSKEFVREWLMENNFNGQQGETIPEMSDEIVNGISERYIELFEKITGETFVKADVNNLESRILKNITGFLE